MRRVIRILIGISTNTQTYELIKQSRLASTREIKDSYENKVIQNQKGKERNCGGMIIKK